MSTWRQAQADGAGRYGSFAEFCTQVAIEGRDMYGWVGDKFYHLYPGGRCIDYTATVSMKEAQ